MSGQEVHAAFNARVDLELCRKYLLIIDADGGLLGIVESLEEAQVFLFENRKFKRVLLH